MSKTTTSKDGSGNGFWYLLLVIAVVTIDQFTKRLIRSHFSLDQTLPLTNFLNITYLTNTGAGFGILQNTNIMLAFVSLIALGLLLFFWDSFRTGFERFCASLIIGGILGNLFDRIALGSVVDFINFTFWPAFNVADSAICIGVIGLVIYYWKK